MAHLQDDLNVFTCWLAWMISTADEKAKLKVHVSPFLLLPSLCAQFEFRISLLWCNFLELAHLQRLKYRGFTSRAGPTLHSDTPVGYRWHVDFQVCVDMKGAVLGRVCSPQCWVTAAAATATLERLFVRLPTIFLFDVPNACQSNLEARQTGSLVSVSWTAPLHLMSIDTAHSWMIDMSK